jgi:dihydrofolate synthase/folylpolyglutamate synthase
MLSENTDPEIVLKRFLNNENNSNFQNYTNEAVKSLLTAAGSPQNDIRAVHVAGTNGKGSTSAYFESIFRYAGYKTGLYTSPHLITINERIKLNGKNISDNDLTGIINSIILLINNNATNGPTWFDVITAAAFIYFKQNNVDIAIIETGLGGLKDSTNIITPLLTVITDISMDHQNLLGNTIELITKEKCGIIKKHTPVITSNTEDSILKIISETAVESESPMYSYGNNFHIQEDDTSGLKQTFSYSFTEFNISLNNISLTHPAETQIKNASLALTGSILLSDKYTKIDHKKLYLPLKSTELMGRFEIHGSDPVLIFDPAHNIASISDLCTTIDV